MRIGIDARLWNETGVGRYTRNLVVNLLEIDKDNEYVFFVLSQDYQPIKDHIAAYGGAKNKNYKWKVVPVDTRWHTVAEQIKFAPLIYREKIDIMHFPYFSVPVLYRKPFVVTIHDLIYHHFSSGNASKLPLPVYKIKWFGYILVVQQAINHAKKIITPLYATAEDIMKTLRIPEDRIEITYEGYDPKIQNAKGKIQNEMIEKILDKKFFLYVGNAYPHKNIDRMLRAFVRFKALRPDEDISLVLVGQNDYFYKRLEERVDREGLKNVIFLHDVSDSELAYLYQHAVSLVAPSLMEGFGLTPLEAMANGCIILASEIPTFREVCRDIAYYFDPKNIESIRMAMENGYRIDRHTKKTRVQKGLQRVNDFSWKRMAEKTLAVYESCVNIRQSK